MPETNQKQFHADHAPAKEAPALAEIICEKNILLYFDRTVGYFPDDLTRDIGAKELKRVTYLLDSEKYRITGADMRSLDDALMIDDYIEM